MPVPGSGFWQGSGVARGLPSLGHLDETVPSMSEHARTYPRILIADDQVDVLEALRLLLSQHDFHLDLVTSPGAVLDALRAQSYDLLVIDLNYSRDTTSGEEGLELLSRIRGVDKRLPIIVMTAWGDIDLAVNAMRRGARSFVQKPWDNATLLQIVHREVADAHAARQHEGAREREEHEALLVQRALLPAMLPSTDRVEIAASWRPAAGFGGDCYDALPFGSDVIGLSVADVAGKGLPAALLMCNLQAAVRAFARESATGHEVCESVNRLLCGHMISGRFATFCYLRLDSLRGRLSYANAGHNPPLLIRANGETQWLTVGGTVLGVFPEAQYHDEEVELRAGDRLVLYTDGITEATSEDDIEFGEARLARCAVRDRSLGAVDLHARLLKEVVQFAGDRFEDDATLMVASLT